jgi:glycosyltransferase involved in cell wall biosynthesis
MISMSLSKPKISVYTTCKNGGRFLRETLDSIFNQTFQDFEIVLVDGASTDNTLAILEEYKEEPRLRWISEPDSSVIEGFQKALTMTRGEYLMCLPISDCYASKNWFQKCVNIFDNNLEVSLIHGFCQLMMEDGSLDRVLYSELFSQPPPPKMDFFPYWLAIFFMYPSITICVRSIIFKKMLLDEISKMSTNNINPGYLFKAYYNFNVSGYLSYCLPMVASYMRLHDGSLNESKDGRILEKRSHELYISEILRYRNNVLTGRTKHVFRDGASEIIKTIEPHELSSLRIEVLKYRMTRNSLWCANTDKLNLNYWRAKFGLIRKVIKGILKIIYLYLQKRK